jgi:hypothetical protein
VLRRNALPLAALAVGLVAALVAAAVIGVVRARDRAKHRNRERWVAARRAWKHPERISARDQPPLPSMLGRRVLGTVSTVAAGELVRRAFHRTER